MSPADVVVKRPRVLFVYYTHTQQALRVCEAMIEELQKRGCDVTQASIEFTDPHYSKNFQVFPFKHAVFGILPLLWPQLRQKTCEIGIPEAARQGDYDLVVSARRRGFSGRRCRCARTWSLTGPRRC